MMTHQRLSFHHIGFSLMFLIPVTDQCLGQMPQRRFVQQVQECFVQLPLLHSKGISEI